MTNFFNFIFTRYPIKTRRSLEMMPGLISWSLIFFPVWGSLLIPFAVAYFILLFDVFLFYKSFSLAITAYIASKKISQAEKVDWLSETKNFKNFKKVTHVIVIPNYKESYTKLNASIASIANQTFPTKHIHVVLAMEEREVKGKSSNESYGGKQAYKKLVETGLIDIKHATISSVDADSIFDKQYFSYLTFKFLKNPKRFGTFWQSANVNYNNFWNVPAPVRVLSFFSSLYRTALLIQQDRLVANSTYSLSFVMLHKIGYWDVDVIPEDYRIFFKAFYKLQGNAWVDPIFLKTSMDAPLSSSYIKSLKNKYNQERRWSWGVSDDPLFIKWWLTTPNVPFLRKPILLYNVLLDHFLWPVNWFIITVAANIMPFVNPVFSRTTLGYNLPRLAGFILKSCLFALLAMIIIDVRNRPKNTPLSRVRQFLFPLEFVLLPVVGFFLSTLPALISHTQLMFGKRLEYKVTEKL